MLIFLGAFYIFPLTLQLITYMTSIFPSNHIYLICDNCQDRWSFSKGNYGPPYPLLTCHFHQFGSYDVALDSGGQKLPWNSRWMVTLHLASTIRRGPQKSCIVGLVVGLPRSRNNIYGSFQFRKWDCKEIRLRGLVGSRKRMWFINNGIRSTQT